MTLQDTVPFWVSVPELFIDEQFITLYVPELFIDVNIAAPLHFNKPFTVVSPVPVVSVLVEPIITLPFK